MTEHSTPLRNSTKLKRKAVHGLALETEKQGWLNSDFTQKALESGAIQPPRKRRHAGDARLAGNDRLCSKDLLYGRKTQSGCALTGNSTGLLPLDSRKRKEKDASWHAKVSAFEQAPFHMSSEDKLEATTAKRMRTDQTEQSTAPFGEDGPSNDLALADSFDSDQEEEPPKYTVIPLPLSLRAQAYLQCLPQQRHGDQGKVPTEQQSLASRGGNSNALILYNPGTHEPIDRTDDCVASGPVPCITGLSPGSSTSSMDVD